jgi:Tfp pilus assembly protein PilF
MGHKTGWAFAASAMSLAFIALSPPAVAQHAVTVYGGGLARDCYEAVSKERLPSAQALKICNLALEEELSRNNRAATHINRGILFMRQQSHALALQDYEAALKLAPDMPEAKINLGAMFYHVGRYSDAVAALNDGVKVKDAETRATAYYNRALAHERLGDVEAAYADYNRALAVQPGFDLAAKQLKRFTLISASP